MLLVMQDEVAAGSATSRQLSQSAAAAVEKQQGGLGAMLVRHMMQAMRLGGKSGEAITFTSGLIYSCVEGNACVEH